MAFDEAKFRKLAAENGYSDEEIDAHLGEMNKATGQPFGAASDKAIKEAAQTFADTGTPMPAVTPTDSRTTLEKTFDFVASPLGTAAIGLVGVGGAAAIKKGLEQRRIGQQAMPEPKEPTLITDTEIKDIAKPVNYGIPAVQRKAAEPAPIAVPAQAPVAASPLDELQRRKEQLMGAVQKPAPVAPPVAPVAVPEQPAVPTVTEAVEAGISPSKAVQLDVAKQLDETPVAGAVAPKKGRPAGSVNKTPEQRLAEKGGLPGMTPAEASMRGHLLGLYGGKENAAAQQAYEQVREILGYTPAYPPGSKGGSLSLPEKEKILGWRKENMPGPKVNLTHDMKSVLKKGSPAAIAALILTPEFAKASTEEKRQIVGEALMPMSMTPSTAEAPGVEPSRFEQAALLGSPYAQTEWAKQKRKSIQGAAVPR